MIRLGLRLTVNGGREAIVRLVITAAAVALGVTMLLITLAGINAVNSQNARYSWLETGAAATRPSGKAPAWWLLSADEFRGTIIGRVDVAATGATSPVPPGIAHLPGPGQFYASPALTTLLRHTPSNQLADRYPGVQIGTIGESGLPAPDSLIVVIGHTPAELARVPGATQVTRISTTPPSSCNGGCYFIGIDAQGIDLILSITAAALLFPVLIFIGTASRLSAARREQRFAAMRLVGATPRQVTVISTVESIVAAIAGVAVGFAVFWALRPLLATIPFTGARFFAHDLRLSVADIVIVAIGVPVGAAVAARVALRRVTVSPLGVTRRVTPQPPRARRLIPLAVGLAELTWFAAVGRPSGTPAQIQAYLFGILLVMAGLISAGPWLTMIGSRLMARRTGRPDVLIAARRLSDNPKAGFRAISGLVLALFVTSVAVGVITTIDFYSGATTSTAATRATLLDEFSSFTARRPSTSIAPIPAQLLDEVRDVAGVRALTLIHEQAQPVDEFARGLVSCADLARTPTLGRCPPGAGVAYISPRFGGRDYTESDTVWPAAPTPTGQLPSLPVQAIAVRTDGSTATIEQARTILQSAYPYQYLPATIAEAQAANQNIKLDAEYRQLVNVVILATLPIAGCSLAVSVAAGLSDRKRPFSLLRLTGAPLSMLRRVVGLESAVPLIVISVIAIAIGFLTAGLFLDSQLKESLQAPGSGYYLAVLGGLALCLAIIASTLPLLDRITGPETARND